MRNVFSSLQLQLDCFQGPLEIFVHLIYRREMKSSSISLKEIFGKTAEQLTCLESASHFLEQFTLLMLVKSRDCLPFEESPSPRDLAPPEEAIIHLSEYYTFKEIASRLDQRQEEQACRYVRGVQEPIALPPPGIEQISLEQLQALFQKVLERLPKEQQIKKDKYSLEDGKGLINKHLIKGAFNLFDFLIHIDSKSLLIVTFLAILELMKEGTLFIGPDYQVEAREVTSFD